MALETWRDRVRNAILLGLISQPIVFGCLWLNLFSARHHLLSPPTAFVAILFFEAAKIANTKRERILTATILVSLLTELAIVEYLIHHDLPYAMFVVAISVIPTLILLVYIGVQSGPNPTKPSVTQSGDVA